MKRFWIIAAAATLVATSLSTASQARQNGPHQIIAYNGHEYAFMQLTHGNGTQFKVFRAIGNTNWEYLGGTTIVKNGHSGSRFQRIYNQGRPVGVVHGDLNIDFYQPYSGFGGSDRLN